MKLEYTEGCTVTALLVDDTPFWDLSEKDRRCLGKLIIDKCDEWLIQKLFTLYLETEGEGGYEYTCDDCGDSVYHYEISI